MKSFFQPKAMSATILRCHAACCSCVYLQLLSQQLLESQKSLLRIILSTNQLFITNVFSGSAKTVAPLIVSVALSLDRTKLALT